MPPITGSNRRVTPGKDKWSYAVQLVRLALSLRTWRILLASRFWRDMHAGKWRYWDMRITCEYVAVAEKLDAGECEAMSAFFFSSSFSLALLPEDRRWRGVALDSCKFHARTETDSAVCASLSRDSERVQSWTR